MILRQSERWAVGYWVSHRPRSFIPIANAGVGRKRPAPTGTR